MPMPYSSETKATIDAIIPNMSSKFLMARLKIASDVMEAVPSIYHEDVLKAVFHATKEADNNG